MVVSGVSWWTGGVVIDTASELSSDLVPSSPTTQTNM